MRTAVSRSSSRPSLAHSSLIGDKRGSVVTLFGLSAMVLAVLTAVVINQVTFYLEKRKLQSATDLAALMLMRSGEVTEARALEILEAEIGNHKDMTVKVTRGHYTPDAAKAANHRFVAGVTPFNAVQVDANLPTSGRMMDGLLQENLVQRASAVAASRQAATLEVGSRLIRLEGGLSQAVLDSLLGYNGKLTVMDYNALASAQVDAVSFLKVLNTKANLNAATFDDVLDANVTVGQVVQALAATTGSPTISATLLKATKLGSTTKFKLADLISIGSLGGLPLDSLSGGSVPVSIGDVVTGAATLSDGDHQVALDLSALSKSNPIANVSLDIGEKPQLLHYDAYASPSNSVSTSQFKLAIGALGKAPASILAVNVNLASATVKLDGIHCAADGTASVTLKANTPAASADIKAPLLPALNVAVGSNEQKTLNFSAAEIAAQKWKPTRSGLGVQVGKLSLAQKLLSGPVDTMLTDLGLNVAEADVKVIDVDCGAAGLVE